MKKKSVIAMFAAVVAAFAILSAEVCAAENVRVTDAGNTWFTVEFDTGTETSGTVLFGTDFYDLAGSASIGASAQHSVTLTGLEPNTLYYFDIDDGSIDDNSGLHYRFVTNIGSGETYFMSNSGSDSADGSYENPWKTINHAKSELEAGDTLLIMDGVYRGAGENVGIVFYQYGTDPRYQVSGQPGNPITYRAYNKGYGSHPVFDGEYDEGICSDYHCTVFKTAYAHDITFDSLWVKNVDNQLAETGGFIARYSDRINFIDCYVSNVNGGDYGDLSGAFQFCGTQDSYVTGAKGWNLHGDSTQNKGAVNTYYGSGSNRYAVNITTTMSEFWDCDAGAQVKSWGQVDNSFIDNYFHDIIADGIHDVGANTLIRGNIIHDAGTAHTTKNDYYHTPSQRPTIISNTFVGFNKGNEFADWHYPMVEVESFRNNIYYTGTDSGEPILDTYYYGCKSESDPCPDPYIQARFHDADNNLFYSPFDDTIIDYMGVVSDLADYQASSGLQQGSLQADPMFNDVSNRDFRLAAASPARTASAQGSYIGAIDPDEAIDRIEVHPLTVSLQQGEEYLFVVKAFDASGNLIPPGHYPVSWSADSGTIDDEGIYTKTTDAGDRIVAHVDGITFASYVISAASVCGDGSCDYSESCESCLDDCGECPVGCIHEADNNPCDGSISISELVAYINRWILGQVSMSDLIEAIKVWKDA